MNMHGGMPSGTPFGLGVLDGAGHVVFVNDDLAHLVRAGRLQSS